MTAWTTRPLRHDPRTGAWTHADHGWMWWSDIRQEWQYSATKPEAHVGHPLPAPIDPCDLPTPEWTPR